MSDATRMSRDNPDVYFHYGYVPNPHWDPSMATPVPTSERGAKHFPREVPARGHGASIPCASWKKNGTGPCTRWALEDSPYCYMHTQYGAHESPEGEADAA